MVLCDINASVVIALEEGGLVSYYEVPWASVIALEKKSISESSGCHSIKIEAVIIFRYLKV